MKKRLIILVSLALLYACTGLELVNQEETSIPEPSNLKTLDITIPEEMPMCGNNQIATHDKPCYEGKYITRDNKQVIQETCGRYWDIYASDEHRAVMERINCSKRNDAVVLYYLKLNRDELVNLQKLLKSGI